MANFNSKVVFELVDKMSSQMKDIQGKLEGLDKATRDHYKKATNDADKYKKKILQIAKAYLSLEAGRRVFGVLADFEQSMAKLKAISGSTADEMKSLRNMIKDLGKTTEFTSAQVADGATFLAMAGFDAQEVLQSLPAVLNLATAGTMDFAQAADISSNILSAFRLNVSETGRVIDVLAVIGSKANTNIVQMGDAMKYIAPIAASAGIPLERTAAVLGVLSDNGMQASMAGTTMRGIISALANPTKDAQKLLAKYGLTMADVNPQTNDFVDILRKLEPLSRSTADSFKLVGDRAAPGLSALTSSLPALEELTKKLKNSAGASELMANIMRDNLSGDALTLVSAIQGLIISIGDAGLTAVLRGVTKALTGVFRALEWASPALVTFLGIMGGYYIITKVIAMVIGFKKAIIALRVAFIALNTTMWLNPIGLWVLSIAAVIAGIVLLASKIEWVRNIFISFWEGAKELIGLSSEEADKLANAEIKTSNIVQSSSQSEQKAQVEINLNNAPKGTTVETRSQGYDKTGTNLNFAM